MNAKYVLTPDDPQDVEVTVTVGGHSASFAISSAILGLDDDEVAEAGPRGIYSGRGLAVRDAGDRAVRCFGRAFRAWATAQEGATP